MRPRSVALFLNHSQARAQIVRLMVSPIREISIHPTQQITLNNNFIEINEANFDQEVLGAMQPVLVEFWAGWSKQCKAMAPVLEFLAADGTSPIRVARVNVEHHEDLTDRYGVRSVPTLLIFNQGGVRDQIVGGTTEQAVRERLELLS